MTLTLPPSDTLSAAWAAALAATTTSPHGQAVHVLVTVTQPCAEVHAVRRELDAVLAATDNQSTETVAATIFPLDLYPFPSVTWSPDLAAADVARLDAVAAALYDAYAGMLPLLLTASGNKQGTYFQRMMSYPGPGAGGFNQLHARIATMRSERARGNRQANYLDMDLATDGAVGGLQLLRPDQKKTRGFPCLVHVDLTMTDDRLHLFAVYRRQNLVTKGYGNLLGLSRLQAFLSQQTGLALGELAMMATFADAEHGHLTKRRVAELSARVDRLLAAEQKEPAT